MWAAALAAGTALCVTLPSNAVNAATPPRELQPVGSTSLVSTGGLDFELYPTGADVSDGGQLVTFVAANAGTDVAFARRPDMHFPKAVSPPNAYIDFGDAHAAPDGSFVLSVTIGGIDQIFLRDTRTSAVTEIRVGRSLGRYNFSPSVSPDSKFVVFNSSPVFGPNGTASNEKRAGYLYLYEVATGEDTGLDVRARHGRAEPFDPVVSSGGTYVAFESADPLVDDDADSSDDIYRYDTLTGDVTLVSRGSGPEFVVGSRSFDPQISADGNLVCYTSTATNLMPGDDPVNAAAYDDIYLTDVSAGTTQRISRARDGGAASGDSATCDISADGQLVTFSSDAPDIVPSDNNDSSDIFVTDSGAGGTALVSRSLGGHAAGLSSNPAIAADGSYIAYESDASNLVKHDLDGEPDIFLTDLS